MAAYTADLGQFDLIYTVFADMTVKIFRLKNYSLDSLKRSEHQPINRLLI